MATESDSVQFANPMLAVTDDVRSRISFEKESQHSRRRPGGAGGGIAQGGHGLPFTRRFLWKHYLLEVLGCVFYSASWYALLEHRELLSLVGAPCVAGAAGAQVALLAIQDESDKTYALVYFFLSLAAIANSLCGATTAPAS